MVPKWSDIRLCLEVRCVNKAVVCLKHQSPTINDILISVQDNTSFSKFGLEGAFYQSQQSLAFLTSLRGIHIWEHS